MSVKKKIISIIIAIVAVFYYIVYSPMVFLINTTATPIGYHKLNGQEDYCYSNLYDEQLEKSIQERKNRGESIIEGRYFSFLNREYAFVSVDIHNYYYGIRRLENRSSVVLTNAIGYDYAFLYDRKLYYVSAKVYRKNVYSFKNKAIVYCKDEEFYEFDMNLHRNSKTLTKEQYLEIIALAKNAI